MLTQVSAFSLNVVVWTLFSVLSPLLLTAQEADYHVYSEAPRLFLNQRRLKLLKREVERDSMRWRQFDALMTGKARMPEPGFANALYGVIAGNSAACRTAADWAAKSARPADPADLRQIALVYDWCLESLSEAQQDELVRRMSPALKERPKDFQRVRSRVLAAFAIADVETKPSQEFLRYVVEDWWSRQTLPALKSGRQPLPNRSDVYALTEILHTVRDNLRVDLREGAGKWFEELAPTLLLSYYPQPWPAAENEYRIPAYPGSTDPDLTESILSRAAEFALVSYDTNAMQHQFLQGWLLQDRFLMRGPLGCTYEFLWANPYQPGLSYTYMPDLLHAQGRLLVRSSWDEDATWLGYGVFTDSKDAQLFKDGKRLLLRPGNPPVRLGPVQVAFAPHGMKFETGWFEQPPAEEAKPVEQVAFVLGLEPGRKYDVEVDDEEMFELTADEGGILELRFPPNRKAGVRVKPVQLQAR
jgi:hypothetical protein